MKQTKLTSPSIFGFLILNIQHYVGPDTDSALKSVSARR